MKMSMLTKEKLHNLLTQQSREDIRELLKENLGESNEVDFKENFDDKDGKSGKLAKHMLAMANNGGGVIFFGVKENDNGTFTKEGLSEFKSKENIGNAVESYFPTKLRYSTQNYHYESSDYEPLKGKHFQVIYVYSKNKHLPYISIRDGDVIQKDTIYIRRNTKSEKINYDELRDLIKKRVNAELKNKSKLEFAEHLSQLNALYEAKNDDCFLNFLGLVNISSAQKAYMTTLDELIAKKIKVVEKILGVS